MKSLRPDLVPIVEAIDKVVGGMLEHERLFSEISIEAIVDVISYERITMTTLVDVIRVRDDEILLAGATEEEARHFQNLIADQTYTRSTVETETV